MSGFDQIGPVPRQTPPFQFVPLPPIESLAPPARPDDPVEPDRNQRLRQAFRAALEVDPELAARARKMATEANVPEQLAYQDPEFATKVYRQQELERRQLWDRNPNVARMLQNARFAQVASDDVDSLVRHDNVFSWIGRQTASGWQQQQKGRIWQDILQAGGKRTASQEIALRRLDDALATAEEEKGLLGGAFNVLGQIAGTAPLQIGASLTAARAAAPFGPQASATAGLWTAMTTTFAQTAYTGMGNAYGQMRDMGLPHEAALKGSLASGLAEGILEAWGVKFATAPLKAMLVERAVAKASSAMTKQTAERALRRFAMDTLKSASGEVGTEVAQTISQHMAESWAIHSSGLSPEEMARTDEGRQKLGDAIGETIVDTALAIGPLSVFFPALRYMHDSRTATAAAKDRAALQMLKEGRAEALLAKRSLPDYMRMLAEQAKATGATHVHVDAGMLQEILKQADAADLQEAADAAGVTVEQLATMAGANTKASRQFAEALPEVAARLDEAAKRKETVSIPLEEFIGKVVDTPVGEALMQHVKFDPFGKTPAEADLWQKEKETLFAASRDALRAAAADEEQWQKEAKVVFDEVEKGLLAANIKGMTAQGARDQADLIRAMVLVGAAEDKVTPAQWWAEHRFEILPALDPDDAEAQLAARAAQQAAREGQQETANAEPASMSQTEGATRTDTPEFKAWFGASKAVDAEGKPLRVFRGIRRPMQGGQMRTTNTRATLSFSSDPEVANVYARQFGSFEYSGNSSVVPAYLSIQNPLDIRNLGENVTLLDVFEMLDWDWTDTPGDGTFNREHAVEIVRALDRTVESTGARYELGSRGYYGSDYGSFRELADKLESMDDADDFAAQLAAVTIDAFALADNHQVVKTLISFGYDGMALLDAFDVGAKYYEGDKEKLYEAGRTPTHETWRPFHDNQIKSVNNPRPTSDPDIMRSNEPALDAGVEKHRLIVERQKRRTSKRQQLRQEDREMLVAQATALGIDPETVVAVAEEHQKNHPQSDGWAPLIPVRIEAQMKDGKVQLDKEGNPKFELKYQTVAYSFADDPETGKIFSSKTDANGVTTYAPGRQKAVDTMARKLRDVVASIWARSEAGDQNAQNMLRQAGWYREMRKRLRHEFGGLGDLFADLLGATSPNTPVRQNWQYSVEVLGDALRGTFDSQLPAWFQWATDIETEEARLRSIFDARWKASGLARGKFIKSAEWQAELKQIRELRQVPDAIKPRKASGTLYGFNSPHIVRALVDLWRTVREADDVVASGDQAPKALNFSGNLIGFRSRATIDVWAARLLQRLAGHDRIPVMAETSVDGTMRPDGSTTGAFGFGQDVFGAATKAIRADAQMGQHPILKFLGEDDLQAIVWFAEKELWTERNWTSASGEGGSFEAESDLEGQSDRDAVKELRKLAETGVAATAEQRKEADAQMRKLLPKREKLREKARVLKAAVKAAEKALQQLQSTKPDSARIPARQAAVEAAKQKLQDWEESTREQSKAIDSGIGKAQRVLDKPDPETLAATQRAALAELKLLERSVDRFVGGISQATEDYVPTDADQAQLIERLKLSAYRAVDATRIVAAKVVATLGKYAGAAERAIDLELIGREGLDVQSLWREMLAVGRDKGQDAVMLSRVLRANEQIDLQKHRPGVEIYWRETTAERQAEIEAVVRGLGQEYFTVIVDGRRTPDTLAGRDGKPVGIRIMFAPEFAERFGGGWAELDEAGMLARMVGERDKLRDLIENLTQAVPEITSAELRHYETRVSWSTEHGTEANDDAAGNAGGVAGVRDQALWAGESVGDAVQRAARHREARARAQGSGEAVGGDAAASTAEPEVQHQLAVDSAGEGFYSALRRGLLTLQTQQATADGWSQAIKGLIAKGLAKQSEVDWSGVTEWLKTHDAAAKITRDELLAWLKANSVSLEVRYAPQDTTAFEAGMKQIEAAAKLLDEKADEIVAGWDAAIDHIREAALRVSQDLSSFGPGDLQSLLAFAEGELFGSSEETAKWFVRNLRDQMARFAKLHDNPRLASLNAAQIMGVWDVGEIYSIADHHPAVMEVMSRAQRAMLLMGNNRDGARTNHAEYRNEPSQGSLYTEMPYVVSGTKIAQPFSDSHAFTDIDNVAMWVRADQRETEDGKLAWRVQEIQSDWAQQGREKGFGDQEALQVARVEQRVAGEALAAAQSEVDALKIAAMTGKVETAYGSDEWLEKARGFIETFLEQVKTRGDEIFLPSPDGTFAGTLDRFDIIGQLEWYRNTPDIFSRDTLTLARTEATLSPWAIYLSNEQAAVLSPFHRALLKTAEGRAFLTNMASLSPEHFRQVAMRQYDLLHARERVEQANQKVRDAEGVAHGPFVASTDAWVELGIKKQLQVAASLRVPFLSFATGVQNNDLYGQAGRVSRVLGGNWDIDGKPRELTFDLRVRGDSGWSSARATFSVVAPGKLQAETLTGGGSVGLQKWWKRISGSSEIELEKLVGADAAQQINAIGWPKNDRIDFPYEPGKELQPIIGGDGNRNFYDQIVRKAAERVAKRLGLQTTTVRHQFDGVWQDQFAIEVPPEAAGRVEQLPLFSKQPEGAAGEGEQFARPSPAPSSVGVRGAFYRRAQTIALFKIADLSTFLHESSHWYLTSLFARARKPNAAESVKQRAAAILKWMGVDSFEQWDALPTEQKSTLHERWSHSFELYLLAGKAPTPRLRRPFLDFRRWLRGVYRAGLEAQLARTYERDYGEPLPALTGEIRQVFDSMIASEQQIREAEAARRLVPMWATREEALAAGWTEERWAAYEDEREAALEAAMARLGDKGIEQMEWLRDARTKILRDRQKKHDDVRKKMDLEVRAELERTPVYRAIAWLAKGRLTNEQGEPVEGPEGSHRLDRDALRRMFPDGMGADPGRADEVMGRLESLGQLLSNDGIHPDAVADLIGTFANGHELVRALMEAQPLDDAVRAEADRRMVRDHSDLVDDGAAEEAVAEALHDEARTRFVALELQALEEDLRRLSEAGDTQLAARRAAAAAEVDEVKAELVKAQLLLQKLLERDRANPRVAELQVQRKAAQDEARTMRARGDEQGVARAKAAALAATEEIARLEGQDVSQARATAKALEGRMRQLDRILTAPGATMAQLTESARAAADEAVRAESWRTLAPHRHEADEARASREAHDALVKGEHTNAIDAKRRQLLHHQLARSATKARQQLEARARKAGRVFEGKDDAVAKRREFELVAAARALAGLIGIGSQAKFERAVAQLQAVAKYAPSTWARIQEHLGEFAGSAKDWRDLSVEQALDAFDLIDSLWEQSAREKRVKLLGETKELQVVQDELRAQMDTLPKSSLAGVGRDSALTWRQRLMQGLSSLKALLRRVEHWARSMDGGKAGPFDRYLWRAVREPLTAYRDQRNAYVREYVAMLEELDGIDASTIEAPELGYTFGKGHAGVGKAELLGALLHMGNDSNRRKMLVGAGWATILEDGTMDTSRWDAFLERLTSEGRLTEQDWKWVQGVWNLFDRLRPQLQEAHREVFGSYFREVPAKAFVAPGGFQLQGGYVPAKTDPMRVRRAQQFERVDELESDWRNSLPAVASGWRHERNEYYADFLNLDVRMVARHLDETIRFVHVQPAIRDVLRVWRSQDMQKQLEGIDPKAWDEMVVPWLVRAARQVTSTPGASRDIDRFFTALRSRVGLDRMFLNISNALQNVGGLFSALAEVKGSHLRAAMASYLRNRKGFADEIVKRSPFMGQRLGQQMQALAETMDEIVLRPTAVKKLQRWSQRHGYIAQTSVQNVIDLVTWQGAFDQFVAEADANLGEERIMRDAVAHADSIVRRTQHSLDPEDIARYEATSPFVRTFLQFSGWFNNIANVNATALGVLFRAMGMGALKSPALWSQYVLGFAAPLIVGDAIAKLLGGRWSDEDDDGYLDEMSETLVLSQLRGLFAAVPGVGQGLNAFTNAWNDQPYDDKLATSPVISALESVFVGVPRALQATFDAERDVTGRNVRDVLTLVTLVTGLPVGALGRPAGYALDAATGKATPSGPIDYTRGLVTGARGDLEAR